MDNLLLHPNYIYFDGRDWKTQNPDADPDRYREWYLSQFAGAGANQVIGEHSTSYIGSPVAAQRIGIQTRPIKLVVILRHPTDRAYSQYWHMVRAGRATRSFEDTIRCEPHSVLNRSLYLGQLESFLSHVSREQVKIVVFEEFVANTAAVLEDLCSFVGADYKLLPSEARDAHLNQSRMPRFWGVELTKNRYFWKAAASPFAWRVPEKSVWTTGRRVGLLKMLNAGYRLVNPLTDSKPPKMNVATRRLLDEFFKRELAGIDEVAGQDVWEWWFK